jgi:hypothetical protein
MKGFQSAGLEAMDREGHPADSIDINYISAYIFTKSLQAKKMLIRIQHSDICTIGRENN